MSLSFAFIIIEVLAALISLYAAIRGRKLFYGFFIASSIHAYYGLLRSPEVHVSYFSQFFLKQSTIDILSLVAAIGTLYALWKVYRFE